MTKEYTSTFSINKSKYRFECDYEDSVRGAYNHDTGHGIVFLDTFKNIEVPGAWEKNIINPGTPKKNIVLNLEFVSYYPMHPALIQRMVNRYKRQKATERTEGLKELVQEIIKTDFHEFIHYFLRTNQIDNDCCSDESHGPGGECWLCDFTHNLKPHISATQTSTEERPEVLQMVQP